MGYVGAWAAALLVAAAACSAPAPTVPNIRPQVLAQLPHETTSFTEGLQRDGTALYESTGLAGESTLRELDPSTGAVRRSEPLPGQLWGEGIAVVGSHIWQLTYQDGVALEWDKATLTVKKQVAVTGEGWGLCYDGAKLIQSDGTATLRFRNPTTFDQTGSVMVTLDGSPLAAGQRAGVRRGAGVGERVAHDPDRAHQPRDGPRDGDRRRLRHADVRPAGGHGRAERHHLARRRRFPAHGEVLAGAAAGASACVPTGWPARPAR